MKGGVDTRKVHIRRVSVIHTRQHLYTLCGKRVVNKTAMKTLRMEDNHKPATCSTCCAIVRNRSVHHAS